MGGSVENPVTVSEPQAVAADVEAALATLAQVQLTSEDGRLTQEGHLALAALLTAHVPEREQVQNGAAQDEDGVLSMTAKTIFAIGAHLSAAPPNWHQVRARGSLRELAVGRPVGYISADTSLSTIDESRRQRFITPR